ncbi:MAG: pksN 5, partial [Acidobacteria bacterium]|nr:pksN 5 [Acidobacteriota bacterium]
GHLDTAAGLAGTIKVALSLAEGEIPATLNFVKANAQIDLESSPFYVADSLRAWRQSGAPRRAAVSSFGIGGTNAHAILEEAPPMAALREQSVETRLHLVPLSARTEERLLVQVRKLRDFLSAAPVFRNAGHGGELRLDDLAYTLQVGREPMACRAAFLVRTLTELKARLDELVAGKETIEGCFHVLGSAGRLDSLIEENDSRALVKSWMENGQPAKAAKLWVTGVDIDWKSLYRAGEQRRISLPTYPFALERFWSPRLDALRNANRGAVSSLQEEAEIETGDDLDGLTPQEALDDALLLQKTTGALLQMASSLLKQKIEEIGTAVEWNELGFDSISLTTFANRLNEAHRLELTPTIFFEHPTVLRLALHLTGTHTENLAASLQVSAPPVRRTVRPRSARKGPAAASSVSLNAREPIAIVGMSGRFPQAPDLDTFWQNLKEGRDCISEIPKDRWDWEAVYGDPSREKNKTDQKWGGFIEGIGEFDPLFFGISPREAELMDPHQRLLMMYVWKVIEDAGYSAQSLSGSRTAIFAGTAGSGYEMLFTQADLPIEGYSFSGVIPSIGPGRMSYFLNFHGPSEPIETACSSSLVAIHRGLSAIYNEQCDAAIVGGINTIVNAPLHISISKAGMLADDGRCKTFSSPANGYVRGEGVGMLMLKRLSAAERDGDHIYALIRATAENHGGRANSMTAPNPQAQVELLTAAYTRAGIDPRTVSYIEAHGTGTSLGDPIEVNALKRAFADLYAATGSAAIESPHCGLGSVKTNVGHLELAAGVAGVMKVLLQLQHGTLVKSLHSEELNPYIQLDGSPFYVVQEAKPWERLRDADGRELPRRAGVSSFGIGGVNAHVVIEEYLGTMPDGPTAAVTAHDPAIIVLSAKNEERLAQQAAQLLGTLAGGRFGDSDLTAIAHTLQTGREAMEARVAMTVVSIDDLRGKLGRFLAGEEGIEGFYRGSVKRNKDPLSIFAADEDLAGTIEAWVEKRKYARLLELWASGMPFDWTRLYGETRPRRVALPTYPFARDRYWPPAAQPAIVKSSEARISVLPAKASRRVRIAETASRAALRRAASLAWREASAMSATPAAPTADLPRAQEPLELMTFEESWTEAALTSLSDHSNKPLICFLSDPEQQEQAAGALRALAPDVRMIVVSHGERYEQHSNHQYVLPPADGVAYGRLLDSIREEHGEVAGILYLWPLEERSAVVDPSAIVHLVKAIAGSNLRCPRLLLAGEFDDVRDRAYFESWMGFDRSLGLVLPNTRVTVVFEQLPAGAPAGVRMTSWLPRLWQELLSSKPESAFYRHGRRHVTRVLPTLAQEVAVGSVLRDHGTYLITGGTGGLGLMFASHLATTCSANLILTGRSRFDAAKQASIEALTAQGAQVLYVQADVADIDAMRAAAQRAVERFGAINGAIHAAGIAGELSIIDNDLDRFRRVLEPKVAGTLVLDEVLDGQPLDFVCYFSSSSAVIGDFGGCDYAMANRFELAHAEARNELQAEGRRQGKALAISWPHWKEGGMSAADEDSESARLYLKSSGQRLLEREEGLAAFERLLGQPGQRHIVMTGKRSRVHHFLGVVDERAARDATIAPAIVALPASKGRRVEMAGLTAEQCVAWDLKEHASILVKIPRERLDADENLADFGFDSIGLGEFAKSLGYHYGIALTPSVFFSHPTLARLAEHLIREHAALFEAFYCQEASRPAAATAVAPAVKTATGRHFRQPRSMRLPAARRDTGAPEPIAIIGMSGRFPQARSVDEMWEILATGRDAVTEIATERFDWRKYYGDPRKEPGKTNCKWSGAVPGVDEFDAMFFDITPLEAETMDPRQRLLLQEAWKALEDAGYGSAQLGRAKVGMFVGVEQGDYQFLVGNRGGVASNNDAVLASRLSYFLNLRGPSMAINTTCSSGLVAAHEACLSLRTGECDTAIAAGVNLMLTPFGYLSMGQAGMLSPDGRCYAFDERANGMVPGEAVVVVVLKRLAQAVADGDPIHAVIRGSGVNYDGKTNGITAPSGAAQTELLREVYERTRTNPREIEYVVTHGTGTKLGDPVEINALYYS